eukprot:126592_1
MFPLLWLTTITGVSAFLCFVITTLAIYHLLFDKQHEIELSDRIKLYCILSCISFTIACIAQVVFLHDFNDDLLLISKGSDMYSIFIQINIGLNGIGWALGEYFLYSLFITRLYCTYKDSIFKVATYMYIILYIPLLIFLFCQIAITLLGLSVYHVDLTHITPEKYSFYSEILTHISATIHFSISSILVYMFSYRLLKLFIMCAKNNVRQRISIMNDFTINYTVDYNDLYFNPNQESLINIVIKHTILSSTAIISSQIFFNISLILISLFNHLYSHLNHYQKVAQMNFIMLAIDCFVNCLCMFLSFKFKDKWYLGLCSIYHNICKWCCTKCVTQTVKKEACKYQASLSKSNSNILPTDNLILTSQV